MTCNIPSVRLSETGSLVDAHIVSCIEDKVELVQPLFWRFVQKMIYGGLACRASWGGKSAACFWPDENPSI